MTFDLPGARSLLQAVHAIWPHQPPTRSLANFRRNLALAWRLIRTCRPDVVVSNGAVVEFRFFLVARPCGIETVYGRSA